MRWTFALAGLAALAACVEQPAPEPTRPMTPCEAGMDALSDPYMDPFQKEAILEAMRNKGCLG